MLVEFSNVKVRRKRPTFGLGKRIQQKVCCVMQVVRSCCRREHTCLSVAGADGTIVGGDVINRHPGSWLNKFFCCLTPSAISARARYIFFLGLNLCLVSDIVILSPAKGHAPLGAGG
jgi:hypothetical protein